MPMKVSNPTSPEKGNSPSKEEPYTKEQAQASTSIHQIKLESPEAKSNSET